VSYEKTAEPIQIPFGGRGLSHVGPINHVLDGVKDRTNQFADAMTDKTAMRPLAKLLWSLVIISL